MIFPSFLLDMTIKLSYGISIPTGEEQSKMELVLKVTEQDIAQHNATEQDFQEILRENFENLSSWLSEAAEQILTQDIHEVEPFTFEPPKHAGSTLFEAGLSLGGILEGLRDEWPAGYEAALGAIASGEVLWRMEGYFWDIVQGGM
jgi:hypothetical protein